MRRLPEGSKRRSTTRSPRPPEAIVTVCRGSRVRAWSTAIPFQITSSRARPAKVCCGGTRIIALMRVTFSPPSFAFLGAAHWAVPRMRPQVGTAHSVCRTAFQSRQRNSLAVGGHQQVRTGFVAPMATPSGLAISVGRVLPTRQAAIGLVVLLAPMRYVAERANSASITSGNVYQAPPAVTKRDNFITNRFTSRRRLSAFNLEQAPCVQALPLCERRKCKRKTDV